MKTTVPFPVTEENFVQCWEYVDTRRRTARKMSVIAKTGKFLINLLLLWMLIFIACGLLYAHVDSPFRGFWENLFPFPYWEAVSARLLTPGASLWDDLIRLVPAAYLAAIAAFVLLAGCIHLVYHPAKKQLPEGTYAEKAELLAKQAQEAWSASFSTKISPSMVATMLAVVTLCLLLFAYVIITNDSEGVTELLSQFPFKSYDVNCLIYVLVFYFISNAVCSPLLLITYPLYRYKFPYDLQVQAEYAAICAREEVQELTPEALAEKRAADAAKTREDALALEKEQAYKLACQMLHQAAICSDIPAMEHYARHCLLNYRNTTARYWLEKAVSSGEASPQAKKMLLRLRLHLRHDVQYLRPEEAPLSTGKKVLRVLGKIIATLWKLLILTILIGLIFVAVALYKVGTEPEAYPDLSTAIVELLPDGLIPER